MENMRKPDFRGGEDERFCGAKRIFSEERLKEYSEDFILPDYLPDIAKVAAIFPDASVKGRFLGSGTLEYDGEVRFRLLYISEDGSLRTAKFLAVFEDKIGNSEFGEDCLEVIRPLCRSSSVRLLNPRKLNLRALVGAAVTVYRRQCLMPKVHGSMTGADNDALQCSIEAASGSNILTLRENGLTLSEDLNFEAVMPTAEELVFGYATIVPQDCRVGEGEAQIRGNADICCIFSLGRNADGREELSFMNRSLVFSQTVKSEDLREGGVCDVTLLPEGCEFRLREDEFGQKRVVEFDLTYLCDLVVCTPKEMLSVADAYSTEKETEASFADVSFFSPGPTLRGGWSVNETVSVDLPEDGGYTLRQCFLFPELRLEKGEERLILAGECSVVLLLADSAGAPDVRRVSVPLRFRTDFAETGGKRGGSVIPRVSGVRCRLEKNTLSLDFEVNYFGQVTSETEKQALESLRVLPETRSTAGKRSSIVICYPEKGESYFEIAKHYGVTPETLGHAADAGAQPEAGVPLFIMKK